MQISKYLQRRINRARQYNAGDVRIDYARQGHSTTLYKGTVVSSNRGGHYKVSVCLNNKGHLVSTGCQCRDWGETEYRAVPVCKHTLAMAFLASARRQDGGTGNIQKGIDNVQ